MFDKGLYNFGRDVEVRCCGVRKRANAEEKVLM
jgi:hypothetical protein